MKRSFSNGLFLNILLGTAYFVFAKIGFAWGALTENASIFWPPSGLALFASLIYGKRIIPGLFCAAVLTNFALSLSDPFSNLPLNTLIALTVAVANIGQAWLIANFARPWFLANHRIHIRESAQFVCIILLGCTIATTVGNSALCLTEHIDFSTAVKNWSVWWLGDAIGMLLVTPILLQLYNRTTPEKNSQAMICFSICIGVGATLFSVASIGHSERNNITEKFHAETGLLVNGLQNYAALSIRDIDSITRYYYKIQLTHDEFNDIAQSILDRSPWIYAFRWTPVSNVNGTPQLVTAETWLRGDSTNSIPPILVDTEIENDVFVARKMIARTQLKNNTLQIQSPIYECVKLPTQQQPSCTTRGLITADINIEYWIKSSAVLLPSTGLHIQLSDTKDPSQSNAWDWQKDSIQKSKHLPNYTMASVSHQISVLNISFNLSTQLISSYWLLPSFMQLSMLLIGLLLVGLLTAYLNARQRSHEYLISNKQHLEAEINQQMLALRSANQTLTKEIDERRNAQEQLDQRERHLRTLIDNIPDPIWFKSVEGVYLSFNKAVEQMFNRPEETVIGKKASNFIPQKLAAEMRAHELEALQSERSVRKQAWIYVPRFNKERLMDMVKIAIRDENKQPIGILGIARDVTENYELINELEKFKLFAEYSSEGFAIMSLDTQILYMNRSMHKLLKGSLIEDAPRSQLMEIIPHDLQQEWQSIVFPSVLLNGFWQGELAALKADGLRFPTKETFFIIRDKQGTPIYLGQVMSDISHQKQAEAALQIAKEAAEEATRAKSKFLANMSHEIRTPLNAVLGYSQLLIADSKLTHQQYERLHSILNAGQRLLYLINDILDLSKIEAGALHLRQDYFDLHQELNDIVSLMRAKAIAKGIALKHDIQLPSPSIIKSDRQKIGQIILNITGNAIKFTKVGAVFLKVYQEGNSIIFNVVDTGRGISEEELKTLFSAFKQGKSGEDVGGTGLGLVISKHIAENLGGDLTLTSILGEGTTARLRLPLTIEYHHTNANEPEITNAHLSESSHCHALVVEDDFSSRDLLTAFLRKIGCKVSEAINGNEGLKQCLAEKPDIIFTDIRMPELTGTEMLAKIREIYTQSNLPVVAISASSLEHERTYYLGQGFDDFIGKPYPFKEIYTALSKFTSAEFIIDGTTSTPNDQYTADKVEWVKSPQLDLLRKDLETLRDLFNSGDLSASKKYFANFTADSIGKIAHQKIQNAIRQYDLVLAENILLELIKEIMLASN